MKHQTRYLKSLAIALFFSFLALGASDDVNRINRSAGTALTCGYVLAKISADKGDLGAFHQKIVSNREDDTARLVLADKLEEQGGDHSAERASLFRMQVELSRLLRLYHTHSIDDLPQHKIYQARELQLAIDKLLKDYGPHWVPDYSKIGIKAVDFHRGIIEGVVLDLEFMDKNSKGIAKFVTNNPDIHRYSLVNVSRERVAAFLNLKGIENITHLAILDGNLALHLDLLTQNPNLKNLKRLDLDNHPIGELGVRELAVSPHLQNLRNLGRLTRYAISDFQAQARAWIQNKATPFKIRKEAFLELLELGGAHGMTLRDLNTHFPEKESLEVWEEVLNQGRFQRRIAEERFSEATKLYFLVPEKLRPLFVENYLERNPVPFALAREIERNLNARRGSDTYEFMDQLLAHDEVSKGDPDMRENREDFRLLYFLRHVHQTRESGKINPTLLLAYQKRYETEWGRISNLDIFEMAAWNNATGPYFLQISAESSEFRKVKGGTMVLGSPEGEPGRWNQGEDKRTVSLSPFELQATQFTWAQFETIRPLFNKRSKRKFTQNPPQDLNRPLTDVSWEDANLICELLNELETQKPAGVKKYKYALPTDAQWEFAVRGGTRSPYYFGGQQERLPEYGWGHPHAEGQTHPVGDLKPNALGFYDMSGNVWEWVKDKYTENVKKLTGMDPDYQDPGSGRVFRGGGWGNDARGPRSSFRLYSVSGDRYDDLGLRLLRTPE